MGFGVLDNFLTTFSAVGTVFFVLSIGVGLVFNKVLDARGVRTLSNLVNALLLPLALFLRLARDLSVDVLSKTWTLPLVGLFQIALNLVLSYGLITIVKPPDHFRRWYILSISVPNNLALPLVFMSSICDQVQFEQSTILTNNSNNANGTTIYMTPDECTDTAELYLFLIIFLITLFFWMFAYDFVLGKGIGYATLKPDPPRRNLNEGYTDTESLSTYTSSTDSSSVEMTRPTQFRSTVVDSVVETAARDADAAGAGYIQHKITTRQRIVGILKLFLKPATAAQLIAIMVALSGIGPFLFADGSVFAPAISAFSIMGEGLVSSLNLVLSGSLGLKIKSMWKNRKTQAVFENMGIPSSTFWSLLFGRMIILPAISFVVLYFVNPIFLPNEKIMYLLSFLIVYTPASNGPVVIAQMAENPQIGEILAVCILFQYAIGIITMTLFMFTTFWVIDI